MAERCSACSASLGQDAAWCPLCHEPSPRPVAPEPARPARPTADLPPRRAERREGVRRFEATAITFGLGGRLVLTVLLTLPILWFVAMLAFWTAGFSVVGLVIYGALLYPRALKDTWRRSDHL